MIEICVGFRVGKSDAFPEKPRIFICLDVSPKTS